MQKINVLKKKKIADETYIISLEKYLDFTPGQVIELTEDTSLAPRMYSICSSRNYPYIDILFDVKENGRLTTYLKYVEEGECIYAGEAKGKFICPQDEKAFWIAAGTGIAPFASMFFSGNTRNKILVHGGKTLESFYFQENFEKDLKENYIRCCTRENSPKTYPGRLTSWLRDKKNFPSGYKYYLCGSAEMVVQTRDILVSRGIGFDRITSEIYF